ncbi:hypothetical protein AB1K54_01215 [Microbacterium sp. BWT-B31]|uniref:hypothetical protein n=1 Tax=Microbacterium sp. BWT-B31 TaxID=3232072 RepID=UPI0035274AFD
MKKNKTIVALAVAAGLVLAPLVAVAPASAAPVEVVECVPSPGSPAVAEVSHTDYWYMPVRGSQGRWSHSDKGPLDIYNWTLYYRTGTTQKHVDVEARPAVEPVTCEQEATTVVVPAAPLWDDPCGPDNASWTPAEQDGVVWESATNDEGVVTATASPAEGYSFPDEAQTEWSDSDSGEPCAPTVVEITPEAPVWTCEEGWWHVDSDTVIWEEASEDDFAYIWAVPAEGYAFPQDAEDVWRADLTECDDPGQLDPLAEDCEGQDCADDVEVGNDPASAGTPTGGAAPTGSLPATGGGAVNPIVPIGAGVITLIGAALFIWRRIRA